MPASLTGLQTFGGGPSAPSNALANTPFNSLSSSAGTGVGNLGQFGGYIPTPLPQFNNYTDYLSFMPGARQMDSYAEQMLKPGYFMYNTQSAAGYQQNIANNSFSGMALNGAEQAALMGLGGSFTETPITINVPGPDGTIITTTAMEPWWQPGSDGFINKDWLPAAQRMYGYGNQMADQAQKLFGQEDPLISQERILADYQNPIIQQSLDPQNALYNRTVQQVQEQQRQALEARGMDMTPYGAGVEGMGLSNFNIDWQNSQLQRMLQGAQGVGQLGTQIGGLAGQVGQLASQGGSLLGGATSIDQAAAQLQQMAAQETMALSRAPMDMWNQINENGMQALQWLGRYGQEAAQPFQKAFQNWQDIQNQFLTANQQSFNQNQTAGFEDPFAMLQLQSQIEMQREQMNMQESMQKSQMGMQGASAAMGMLGGK